MLVFRPVTVEVCLRLKECEQRCARTCMRMFAALAELVWTTSSVSAVTGRDSSIVARFDSCLLVSLLIAARFAVV